MKQLPRPNNNGQLAMKDTPDANGPGATKSLLQLTNVCRETRVTGLIREKFPNAPLYTIPSSETLANKLIDQSRGGDNRAKIDRNLAESICGLLPYSKWPALSIFNPRTFLL